MSSVVNQAFPSTGSLARNKNLSLTLLRSILRGQDGPVYAYIVDTVRCDGHKFVQTGSGPNFQGDLITLSTCKHQMRSGVAEADWPGGWVAGFTGVDVVPGHHVNYLVYLMKVERAYLSHRDLWNGLDDTTRVAKAADRERLGDLYRPLASSTDPFDPNSYKPPRADHAHCHQYGWHVDIDYVSIYGRRAPLLVGDKRFSFLWRVPLIAYPSDVHARTKKHSLRDLLGELSNRPIREGV